MKRISQKMDPVAAVNLRDVYEQTASGCVPKKVRFIVTGAGIVTTDPAASTVSDATESSPLSSSPKGND